MPVPTTCFGRSEGRRKSGSKSDGGWTNLDAPVPSEHLPSMEACIDQVVEEDMQRRHEYCFQEQQDMLESIGKRLADAEFEISKLLKHNGLQAEPKNDLAIDFREPALPMERKLSNRDAPLRERKSNRSISEAVEEVVAAPKKLGKQQRASATGISGIRRLESTTNRTSYAIEKSVYGVIVTPGRTLGYGAWVMLAGHYSITVVLAYLIWLANQHLIGIRRSALYGEGHSVCTRDGQFWDCTPKGYTQLVEFDRLDTDSDGYWSVAEATKQGLLQQFKAIHEVARNTKAFIDVVFPYQNERKNEFCGSVMDYNILGEGPDADARKSVLIGEFLNYSFSSDERAAATFIEPHRNWIEGSAFYACNRTVEPTCWWRYICDRHVKLTAQAKTSELQYREATQYFSVLPRRLHAEIKTSLLTPCRLVSPLLCGNVEVGNREFMTNVSWWYTLPPDERVIQCKSFVGDICPLLFGLDYENLQSSLDGTCGDARIETRVVKSDAPPFEYNATCSNNDAGMQTVFTAFRYKDHILDFHFLQDEKYNGYPANYYSTLGCSTYAHLGWCNLANPVGTIFEGDEGQANLAKLGGYHPSFFSIGQVIGLVCAGVDGCCDPTRLDEIGCPSSCRPTQTEVEAWIRSSTATNDEDAEDEEAEDEDAEAEMQQKISDRVKSALGEFMCYGAGCRHLQHHVDNTSGSVRFFNKPYEGYSDSDTFKIVILSSLNARVYILGMNIGPDSDIGCAEDAMIINEIRLCKGNQGTHDHIDLPQRHGLNNEIGFLPQRKCEPRPEPGNENCTWEILISDRGTPPTFNIPFASFSEHNTYWDAFGKISRRFAIFFYLILFVWVAFVWLELHQICAISLFILYCPDVTPFRRHRILYMVTVVLPRTAIWGFTLLTGVFLLVDSETLVECVLNNVALAFILDIDNLLYSLLAPQHLQDHLDGLAPFEWDVKSRLIFDDFRLLFLSIAIFAMTAVIVWAVYMMDGGFYDHGLALDCICNLEGEYCRSAVMPSSKTLLYGS